MAKAKNTQIQKFLSVIVGDKLYKPVSPHDYADAAAWCNSNRAKLEDKGEYYEVVLAVSPLTVQDYDNAMENYLRETRTARGYTLREPSDYKDSSIPRWKQDAIDWIAFRDAVLTYGLEIENTAEQTGVIPSMEEFLAGMPVITWTYQE